jgi:hypothetical protein
VRNDVAIHTADDLRGKKVGGSTVGSLEYGWMKELLPKFGLQLEKDVTFLPIGSPSTRYTALRAGTIDATPLSPPASFLAQDNGYPTLLRWADHLEDIRLHVTTDERLARQGDLVRRFGARPSKASGLIWPIAREASRQSWNLPGKRSRTDDPRLRRPHENHRSRRRSRTLAAYRHRAQQTLY